MRTLKICKAVLFCLLVFGFITPSVTSAADTSPYGLNDWNFTDVAMTAAQEAGVGWMRIGVNWRNIEPIQGQIEWSKGLNANLDFYISQTQKYGMQVTVVPYNSPDWVRQPGLNLPKPEFFSDFVKALLTRYPGQIAALEILNEENTGSWPVTKNRDAIFYVPILKAAYKAVKEVSPNTLVLTSSLWSSPVGYLEDMYALGAKGYFDVVNFHYYPGKNSPKENYTWLISHYRKVMQKYGDGAKSIWLTEFGWNITDAQQSASNIVSPQDQSDYMTYVLDSSRKSGFVKKVFWYDLHNDDGMAMMHATDYYDWRTPARLNGAISASDISLTVGGGNANKWPQSGLVTIDNERIRYSSLTIPQQYYTSLQGLTRGVDGTTAASHAARALVYNQDVNPELISGILAGDTTLTITGNKWTTRWPSNGVLIIDSENIKYSSAVLSGANTTFRGLTRGYENTAPAEHSVFVKVKNQDLTANFRRKIYYTYKNFIQANPAWNKFAPLADVPLAASAPISITNADFEAGLKDWFGISIDQTIKRSGLASAKLVNDTGMLKRAGHSVLPIEPNKSYFLKAYVRIDPAGSGNMNTMVQVNLQDASGKYLTGGPSNYYIYETSGAFREVHYPFRTPANAAQLVIYLSTTGGIGTAWFDDISVEPYDLSHKAIMGRR